MGRLPDTPTSAGKARWRAPADEKDQAESSSVLSTLSKAEKQFLLVILVVLLYHFNVFSFFHKTSSLESRTFSSWGPNRIRPDLDNYAEDFDEVDKAGLNWVAITDPVVFRCLNLDNLIKQRGDVAERESAQWAEHQCESKLAGLYKTWKEATKLYKPRCEELRAENAIEPGVDWGDASEIIKKQWRVPRPLTHPPRSRAARRAPR